MSAQKSDGLTWKNMCTCVGSWQTWAARSRGLRLSWLMHPWHVSTKVWWSDMKKHVYLRGKLTNLSSSEQRPATVMINAPMTCQHKSMMVWHEKTCVPAWGSWQTWEPRTGTNCSWCWKTNRKNIWRLELDVCERRKNVINSFHILFDMVSFS